MDRLATAAATAILAVGMMVAPSFAEDRVETVEWVQATCTVEQGQETSEVGARYVRGEKHHDTIHMDLGEGYVPVGTNLITMDYDVSLETGDGQGGGTFVADMPGLGASFSGHFNGPIRSGMLTARAVGDGSGAMAGARMEARIVQFPPTAEQLSWMCGGEEVHKAVKVTAQIRPAAASEYARTECVTATGEPEVNEAVDGVLTIRALPYLGVLSDASGAQMGTNTGIVDIELDQAVGTGWIRGTLKIRDEMMGDFDGSFEARYEDFAWEGRGTAIGVNSDAGKQLTMDVRSFVPDEATCGKARPGGWIDGAGWQVVIEAM